MPATLKTYGDDGFTNEHSQWEAADGLCFFHAKMQNDELMKLEMSLGYDGPIRVWLDGAEFFVNMQGTNPCLPDESRVPLQLQPGTHDITVGIDLNQGRAWGFFLRFIRRDVTLEQMQRSDFKTALYST